MLREGRGWGSFGASYGLGKQKGEENPPEESRKESLASWPHLLPVQLLLLLLKAAVLATVVDFHREPVSQD